MIPLTSGSPPPSPVSSPLEPTPSLGFYTGHSFNNKEASVEEKTIIGFLNIETQELVTNTFEEGNELPDNIERVELKEGEVCICHNHPEWSEILKDLVPSLFPSSKGEVGENESQEFNKLSAEEIAKKIRGYTTQLNQCKDETMDAIIAYGKSEDPSVKARVYFLDSHNRLDETSRRKLELLQKKLLGCSKYNPSSRETKESLEEIKNKLTGAYNTAIKKHQFQVKNINAQAKEKGVPYTDIDSYWNKAIDVILYTENQQQTSNKN